jgi:ABC-2 type transport system ATP-binding protein
MVPGELVTAGLHKQYGGRAVLTGLSFTAAPGKLTLVAGRNGAGKTTWMRIAAGLARASQGTVTASGLPVDSYRARMAVVFDEGALYPHLTGAENLYVLSRVKTRPPNEQASRLLEMLGLDRKLLHRKAGQYSFGQRKRVAIACALLRNPLWLLLDEPTVGLDPVAWEMVKATLRDLAERGAVIVLTGQDLNALESTVDQVVVLHQGQAVFTGSLLDLLKRRPPLVRAITPQPERLLAEFPAAARFEHRQGTLVEIPCPSAEIAEVTMAHIQAMQIPASLLEVRTSSLEEAFLELVGNQVDARPKEEHR